MYFPPDASETLSPEDVVIASRLAEIADPSDSFSSFRALEIGVWLGAWALAVLKNVPDSSVEGIDPYPFESGIDVRTKMLLNMRREGVSDRYTHHDGWSDSIRSSVFNVVHVDGLHEEEAVVQDLVAASQSLGPGGIIVVDDFRHFYFPGIASAYYQWCQSAKFAPIVMTKQKAYVARIEDHGRLQERALRALREQRDLKVEFDIGDAQPDIVYASRTAVAGRAVILVSGAERRLHRIVRSWCPPVVWGWLRRSRGAYRRARRSG